MKILSKVPKGIFYAIFCMVFFAAPFSGLYFSFNVRAFADVVDEAFPQIASLPVIRVGVVSAPGNGHQSASANVVNRLRSIGYSGEIEIVYNDENESSHNRKYKFDKKNKDKIYFLLPPFKSEGPAVQVYENEKLKFVSSSYFKSHKGEFADLPFGIIGADDLKMVPSKYRVQVLLTLQPYLWSRESTLAVQLKSTAAQTYTTVLKQLSDMSVYIDIPKPENTDKFIEAQMSHAADLQVKIPGVKAIIEQVKKSNIELAPAYGHEMNSGQALLYVGGILYAANQRPDLFSRGVVVPLLNSLDQDIIRFYKKQFSDPKFENKIEMVDISDPHFPELLKGLQKGQILIVVTGPVTKSVFEYLYSVSTLPPTVEGVNSIDLMRQIGRPYLPTTMMEGFHLFKDFSARPSEQHEQFYLVHRAMSSDVLSMKKSKEQEVYKTIGEFIIAAKDSRSDIYKIFVDQAAPPINLENDKFQAGLKEAEKIVLRAEKDIQRFLTGAKVVAADAEKPFTPHEWLEPLDETGSEHHFECRHLLR